MKQMTRESYRLFSKGDLGNLTLTNRLMRSATWDPSMIFSRQLDEPTLDTYRKLATGGAGVIIVGDFGVLPKPLPSQRSEVRAASSYEDVRVHGLEEIAAEVHKFSPDCRVIAQVSVGVPGRGASAVRSPFSGKAPQPLTSDEIERIVGSFAIAIEGVMNDGFDGVQLHAAHGGLLARFLSPYSNQRSDAYGGSPLGRTQLIREILSEARQRVANFPILIKLNGTDYLEGGIDPLTLQQQAKLLADAGIDAIEISGGMWECLLRSEAELGFRPVPAPESHTRISKPEAQSYFLPHARAIDVNVPVILCGGNRDIEALERIVSEEAVDFIAMSRPLIREPDLPRRWLEGRGASMSTCISCNGCLYHMYTSIANGDPQPTRCLLDHEPARVREAEEWLTNWSSARIAKTAGD
ncbi:hypothetical protein ACFLSW_03320 [Candidatus Bipolaricaulota bacterium]